MGLYTQGIKNIVQKKKIFLVSLLLLFLSGCSVKLFYNKLDWMVSWQLRDYISWDAEQHPIFKKSLNEVLDQHRHYHLPVYSSLVMSLHDKVDNGWTQDDIEQVQNAITSSVDRLLSQSAPSIIPLLKSLDDSQVYGIEQGFEKSNQKFVKKFVQPTEQEQREKQAKNLVKQIQRFTGRLNEEQLALIEDWSQRYHLMGHERLVLRQAWQGEFLGLLAERNEPNFVNKLTPLLAIDYQAKSEIYQNKIEQNQALMYQLMSEVSNRLDNRQRLRLKRNLIKLADDLNQLAAA